MKRALVTLLMVVLGVALVGGVAVFNSVSQAEPPTLTAEPAGTLDTPQGTLPHATLELAVYPNSSEKVPPPSTPRSGLEQDWLSGQPFFHPSTTIQVPANSAVTITFIQYDSGGQIYNPFFAEVHGSMDGTMKWNGNSVTEVKSDSIGHTFTVHQYSEASQPEFFLSVPLPMNPANAKTDKAGYPLEPQKIEVTFITGDPGTYVWNCEFPCGDLYQEFGGPMQQRGWMAGTFEVV